MGVNANTAAILSVLDGFMAMVARMVEDINAVLERRFPPSSFRQKKLIPLKQADYSIEN